MGITTRIIVSQKNSRQPSERERWRTDGDFEIVPSESYSIHGSKSTGRVGKGGRTEAVELLCIYLAEDRSAGPTLNVDRRQTYDWNLTARRRTDRVEI